MLSTLSRMLLGIAFAVVLPAAAFASTYQCSVLDDPVGDTSDSPGSGHDGQPYQDIIESSIERSEGAITFSMKLAAPLPEAPEMKNANGLLLWMWGMNTGTAFPLGYPLAPGNAGLLEFWVHLAWDGTEYYAEVIDRRPTVQGQQPIITPAPFFFNDDRTRITIVAPTELFDDPMEFRWGSTTWIWSSHLGTSGGHSVDRAPDDHVTTCTADN
jgi:hypothetical protein